MLAAVMLGYIHRCCLFFIATCCVCFKLQAEPKAWKSEIEFGFQRLTGNSDSMALNSRFALAFTKGAYLHTSEIKFLQIEKDGEEDKHKTEFESQANLKFDERQYVLANINYVDDKYGPYFKNLIIATGLGYQALWQENLSLLLEIGPGFRYQTPNLDEIGGKDLILPYKVREAIMRAQASFGWTINKNLMFEARVTVVSGGSNTSVETRAALSSFLLENLSIKLSTVQNYINEVPPGMQNRDSIFTVTVGYRF